MGTCTPGGSREKVWRKASKCNKRVKIFHKKDVQFEKKSKTSTTRDLQHKIGKAIAWINLVSKKKKGLQVKKGQKHSFFRGTPYIILVEYNDT